MSRISQVVIAVALVALSGAGAGAQAPATGTPPQPPATTPPAAEAPKSQPGYTYDPTGRRDPFVSLLGRGGDGTSANRPSGLAGLLINEVSLKGIMRDRSGFIAMIQGPDKKTYMVKAGDKLMDGSVKSIDAGAVVFSQDVNDPLSLIKQREIRKTLRSEESRG